MPQEAHQTRSVSGAGDPSTFSMWREMGVWAHPLGFSAVNSKAATSQLSDGCFLVTTWIVQDLSCRHDAGILNRNGIE